MGDAERGIYHAAKHGVIGFTKSAALEYASRGVPINAVCPGLIWTPMADQMVAGGQDEALKAMEKSRLPMARVGRLEEIADAVLWHSSDASSYVTSQSVSVDGGFVMRRKKRGDHASNSLRTKDLHFEERETPTNHLANRCHDQDVASLSVGEAKWI